MTSSKLQTLLDSLSRLTLSETVSNHRQIATQFLPLMDKITADDLEISRIPQFPKKVWFYYPIRETEIFTLAVFALPAGLRLPLHDHPQMTVLCKPLLGRLRQTSHVLGADRTDVLVGGDECGLVEAGTIHEVEALEDSAFLDLVLPPYAEDDRKIRYYERDEARRVVMCPMPGSNRSVRMSTGYGLTLCKVFSDDLFQLLSRPSRETDHCDGRAKE